MHLENFIGKEINIKLNSQADDNSVLNLFFDSREINTNKLISVDEIGIWVEGFIEGTVYGDINEAGEVVPKEHPETEFFPMGVLVSWGYIEGIFVASDPTLFQTKKVGFK